MTSNFLILFGFLGLVASCNNQPQNSKNNKPPNRTGDLKCYSYINNKDTVLLKTKYTGDSVTGTVVYNFFEKDKNTGTIQGQINDDLLIADYTFISEGMSSVRQVAFKKSGNNFIEGYGDIEDINGKIVFKNIDSLNFNHSMVLKEVDCPK